MWLILLTVLILIDDLIRVTLTVSIRFLWFFDFQSVQILSMSYSQITGPYKSAALWCIHNWLISLLPAQPSDSALVLRSIVYFLSFKLCELLSMPTNQTSILSLSLKFSRFVDLIAESSIESIEKIHGLVVLTAMILSLGSWVQAIACSLSRNCQITMLWCLQSTCLIKL